jgi:hypothetical protein
METIKEIVQDNYAILDYICEGKLYYTIETKEHKYQLEIDSCDDEWKAVYIKPEMKAISLMRWIRKGMDNDKFMEIR